MIWWLRLQEAVRLGDDMGIPVAIPPEYEKKLQDFFASAEDSTHGPATIRNHCRNRLMWQNHLKLAYAAAGAGLMMGGAATARFLDFARTISTGMGDRAG